MSGAPEDGTARLRQLEADAQNLVSRGQALEEWLGSLVTNPGELVTVDFDESGLPWRVYFEHRARQAVPEQLENALSRAVVNGINERRPTSLDPSEVKRALTGLAEGGYFPSGVATSSGDWVSVETVMGRPVRLLFREGFVANAALSDISRCVAEACAAALTTGGERSGKHGGQR